MNRVISCFFFFLLTAISTRAQHTLTLQQCIDSSLAHNIPVKQYELLAQSAQVNWKQARMNLLPDLNANISHGLNSGRSIDPFTNTYVTQSVNTATYGMNSGLTVFNGLTLQNRIRETASAYEASRMEWQQQKDELVLNVILSYLTVLNNEDRVQVALKQTEISQQAVDRLTVLNNQGAIKPSDLSDLKGQLMNDQLAVLTAKDQLETSKLLLAQWMNKPYDTHMKLERINVEEALTAYAGTPDDVYQSSLNQFAQVKAVELRRKSAEYSVKTARGQLYPSVSVGAGINTNYSSIAQSGGQKISYTNQLRNNRYTSVGVGVSIPIFNGSFARNRIKLADINLRNNELVEENTRLQLRQLIDQAYLSMTNAFERYKVLLDQVNAYQESFRAAEVRYQAGVGTSIDYLTAKDRLDRANVNLLNAQYDYILRKRILDYYRGSTK
jgi:outer membrane protein